MADNNKVTIDAAWFAELYAKWQKNASKNNELFFGGPPQSFYDKIDALEKERDELKAKLAEHADLLQRTEAERVELKTKLEGECKNCVSQEEAKVLAESLAAAERCIDQISVCNFNINTQETIYGAIQDIIRAYREKEEK